MTNSPLSITTELVNRMQKNASMEPRLTLPMLEMALQGVYPDCVLSFEFKEGKKIGETFEKQVYIIPFEDQEIVLSFMHFIPSNHWTVSSLRVIEKIRGSLAA